MKRKSAPRLPWLIVVFFFSIATSLQAQWTIIANNVFCNASTPTKGFGAVGFKDGTLCGGMSNIFLSLDTGKTWTTSLTLVPGNWVDAIDFFDSANFLVKTTHNLYITSDRGNTWSSHLIDGYSACFAGSLSKIVVSSFYTIQTSNNGGATFTKTHDDPLLSFAITDVKYHGNGLVIAIEDHHLIVSTDYGMTWNASNKYLNQSPTDSWSLTFSPCDSSNQLFVVNENLSGPPHIYTTSDNGTTWQLSIQRANGFFSGFITAFGNSVFFETMPNGITGPQGVFRSTNLGVSWDSIGGPSTYQFDSRMIIPINNNTILAGDQDGNVWRTDNAGGFPVISPPPTFTQPKPISINDCQKDSTQLTISGLSCRRYHITSAKLLGADTSSLRMTGKLPPLILSDVVVDTIGIVFTAKNLNGVLSDSIKITWYNEGDGIVHDTTIPIPLTVTSLPLTFTQPKPISINECQRDSTQFTIAGPSCRRYHFTSAKLLGADTSSLRMTGNLPPLILSDGAVDTIGIVFTGKDIRGVLFDSIKITWYDESDGIARETTIPIPLMVTPLPPNLQANISSVQFDTTSLCVYRDTVIALKNIGCNTVDIYAGPGTLSRTFTFDPIFLPIFLPPDSSVFIHFHFRSSVPGSYGAVAQFLAEHDGFLQQINIPLTGFASGTLGEFTFNGSMVTMLPVTTCTPKRDTTITLVNNACDALLITSGPDGLGNGFSADPIQLPKTIVPGDSLRIVIHFNPSVSGNFQSNARFTGDLGGVIQNDTISLTGQNIGSKPGLTLTDTIVNFHNVSLCNSDRDTLIKLFNRGCDTLTLITGPGSLGNGFTADVLPLPVRIPPDSLVTIRYHFHPLATTHYQTTAFFTATANGLNQQMSQTLSGDGVASSAGPVILQASFIFDTISICGAVQDTTVIFSNRGCDTLKIVSGPGTLGSGFTIGAFSLPIIIAPNDSVAILFHFSPPSIGNFSATPKFTLEREGKQSTIQLYLQGSGKSEGGELTYAPKKFNFQSLSICAHDSVSGVISNVGCDSVRLDPAAIFGDPDYLLSGLGLKVSVAPREVLNYTVYLNPAQKGLRTGYIIFSSNTSRDSIPLSVTVTDGTRILSSSVNVVDFGTRSVCDNPRDSSVTLRNTGCDTLVITGVGGLGLGFASNTKFPFMILPGKDTTIDIFTLLDTAGEKTSSSATVTFTSNSDNSISPINLIQTYSNTALRGVGLFIDPATKRGGDSSTVSYDIKETPGKTFTGANIQQINFDLNYNTDLLNFDPSQSTNVTSANGINFTINGTPELHADANGILASVAFRVFLSKDSVTTIGMTTRIDTTNGPCGSILTTSVGGSATFNYNFICGERIISGALNGIIPMKIISLRPNPAQDEIIVDVESGMKQDATIEIYDALGAKVFSYNSNMPTGAYRTSIDIKKFSGGVYLARINSASGSVSQSFVKVR